MKKLFFVFAFAALSLASFAQKSPVEEIYDKEEVSMDKVKGATPEKRADKVTAKINEIVGLTADQSAQVKQIALKHINQFHAQRPAKGTPPTEEFKKLRHQHMKAMNTEIMAVLTAEQQAKIKAMRKERRGEKGKGKGRKG